MNTEHVHRDDVPVDINAVIIDNVLNGSEVYGSGRRLARAMLPISGGMCTSSTQLFSTATTTGRCSTRSAPPRPPTHLVATMPQLRDTRVTRLARARASTPSGTRVRGRAYCSTSQLRPGIPTVFTVRTCAQRSSSTTRPATACGHFHISNIYGYASPHGGATVRVSHRPVAPEACNT